MMIRRIRLFLAHLCGRCPADASCPCWREGYFGALDTPASTRWV